MTTTKPPAKGGLQKRRPRSRITSGGDDMSVALGSSPTAPGAASARTTSADGNAWGYLTYDQARSKGVPP